MKPGSGIGGVVLGVVLCAACAQGALARSVAYAKRRVLGVPVHVITVNLADPNVRVSVVTARDFPGGAEPIDHLLARSTPSAAVTGTYFSKRTRFPVGDIVVGGVPRYFGGMGTALAITPYNTVEFRTVPYGRHQDWSQFETVLAAGPRLLRHGRVLVNPRAEGFSDPHVLGRARRTAVGSTAEGKLQLVATERPLTLTELAKVLARLGAVEAMALDGGGSTAMYFGGRHRVRAQRSLVNLLVVHEDVPLLARTITPMSPQAQAAHRSWRLAKAAQHHAASQRLRERGERTGAMAHLGAAMTLAPDNASYRVALAGILEAEGEAPAAAGALAEAGSLLIGKGEYEHAAVELTRALALDRLNRTARTQLGLAYLHLDQVAAARAKGGQATPTASSSRRQAERTGPAARPRAGEASLPAMSAGRAPAPTVLSLPLFARPDWLARVQGRLGGIGSTGLIVRDVLGGGAYVLRDVSLLAVVALMADALDYVHVASDLYARRLRRLVGSLGGARYQPSQLSTSSTTSG